jgi:hypothetical protein
MLVASKRKKARAEIAVKRQLSDKSALLCSLSGADNLIISPARIPLAISQLRKSLCAQATNQRHRVHINFALSTARNFIFVAFDKTVSKRQRNFVLLLS